MSAREDAAYRAAVAGEAIEEERVPEGVRLVEGFPYGCAGDRILRFDLYDRVEPPPADRPAMVFLHGGCWKFGSPRQFLRQASRLSLRYGILSVSVDYRMSGEARFPAALQDAKCAIRWLRAHAREHRIDPDRIGVCGGSAGAHLAAMAAATADVAEYEGEGGWADFPSHANLAVPINGEFDLPDLIRKGNLVNVTREFLGKSLAEDPALYDRLSPIKLAHGRMPPMLFLHGDQDRCVSHEQSVAMHERLLALGVPSEIEIYPGKPHAWFNRADEWLPVQERMERFLEARFGVRPRAGSA